MTDTLRPGNYNDVDRVTDTVNRWDGASGREARRRFYRETLGVNYRIVFK